MMLKPISSSIFIGVAAKIGQYEEGGFARILWLALDRLPQLRAEAVSSPNSFDVQRIGSSMRDVDVVHGDPQQTGCNLSHQLVRNIQRQLIRARQRLRMRLEIVDREFQDVLELLQLEFVAFEFRRVIGRLIVVTQQMLIVRVARGSGT